MCKWTDCLGSRLGGVKADADLLHPLRVSLSPHPFIEQQPLTSSTQPLPPSEHFQFADKKSLLELAKGYTPANTSRSTKWALKVFELWSQARNQHQPEADIPHDLLTKCDPAMLNTHVSRFVVEIRKTNGDYYPPATINQLLCGLLRNMRKQVALTSLTNKTHDFDSYKEHLMLYSTSYILMALEYKRNTLRN